ncbi:MAG: MFS transporter [bacterium]|nr:MFS transporter [bacterium]
MKPLYTPQYLKLNAVFCLLFISLTMFYLLPIHIENLGGSRFMIGVIMGSCEATAVVLRLFFSGAMDRAGRKKVLFAGAALMAAACFLFPTVDRPGMRAILLRVLLGAGYGAFFTASFTIAAALSPPERLAEALGTLGVGAMIAQGVGPWLGGRVVAAHGFSGMFAAAGVFAAAGALITLSLEESTSPAFCLADRRDARRLLTGALPWLMVLTFCHAAGRGSIISFFSDFARGRGLGNPAVFFAAFSAAAVAGRLAGGRAIDRIGRRRMLIPSIALFAAGPVSVAFIASTGGMAASGALCGLGQALLYPVLMSLSVAGTHVCDLGVTVGLFTASFDAGLGAGSIAWGAVAGRFGYTAMYLSAGAVVAASAAFRRKIGERAAPISAIDPARRAAAPRDRRW